jgi:hypothetical protein
VRFNVLTSCVVSCYVPVRTVSSWMLSTMRLMLFFDGRNPKYALPVLAEYMASPIVSSTNTTARSLTMRRQSGSIQASLPLTITVESFTDLKVITTAPSATTRRQFGYSVILLRHSTIALSLIPRRKTMTAHWQIWTSYFDLARTTRAWGREIEEEGNRGRKG